MAKVTIRYWAAAKDAAGMPEESLEAATLATRLTRLSRAGNLTAVWRTSSRGRRSWSTRLRWAGGKETLVLDEGAVIEVLPPFAGG